MLVLEIDLCANSPCENNGTCQNFKTYYTCTCLAGFQGVNCETGINKDYVVPENIHTLTTEDFLADPPPSHPSKMSV